MKKLKAVILILLLVFSALPASAQSKVDYHIALGLGVKYGVIGLPLININYPISDNADKLIYIENAIGVFIQSITVGYFHKLSPKGGLNMGLLNANVLFGSRPYNAAKIGYVYNHLGFNQSGYEITIESYITDYTKEIYPPINVSFGYHW